MTKNNLSGLLLLLLLVASVFVSSAMAAPPETSAGIHIMLTNDDGIDAPGLLAIEKALLKADYRVSVVAPARQQSGSSSSITGGEIQYALRGDNRWAIEAKPVDAVRIGLGYLLANDPPDLVISGANRGQNVGPDTMVSGTVGAAMQARRKGIPAIAISVAVDLDEATTTPPFKSTLTAMDHAAEFLVKLIQNDALLSFAAETLININYPARQASEVKGIRLTRLSKQALTGGPLIAASDQSVHTQFNHIDPNRGQGDAEAIEQGYISISFLNDSLGVSETDHQVLSTRLTPLLNQ